MIDWLLKKTGISEETARSVAGAAIGEAKTIAGDVLGSIVTAQASQQVAAFVRPQLLAMRAKLLEQIAGEPPAGFGERLRLRGYDKITDEQVSQLWADVVASIAEQPATSPTLSAVS